MKIPTKKKKTSTIPSVHDCRVIVVDVNNKLFDHSFDMLYMVDREA
jgi:hypothetical protein